MTKLLGICCLAVETGDDCETCETSIVPRQDERRVAIRHLQPPCFSWCEPHDKRSAAQRPESRDDRRLSKDARRAVCRARATLILSARAGAPIPGRRSCPTSCECR